MSKTLFPIDIPASQWVSFPAEGFSRPACGVIYRLGCPAVNGMPLGAIDTGHLDLETSGLWGFSTIFNTHIPPLGPLNLPFLGISIGGQTWVLCDPSQVKGYEVLHEFGKPWPLPPGFPKVGAPPALEGVKTPREIHYWGHYPIADLEFEMDAPVGVGLRAWAPFIPGDIDHSVIPGIVFEVHLHNLNAYLQAGALAFSFLGTLPEEAGSRRFLREEVHGSFQGMAIKGQKSSYVLGVIGNEKLRLGGGLGADGVAWSQVDRVLPDPFVVDLEKIRAPEIKDGDPGATAAVDFTLQPGEEKIVRFILAWYSPQWNGGGNPWAGDEEAYAPLEALEGSGLRLLSSQNTYTHMYASYYPTEIHAAFKLAEEHEYLLQRILSWQEAVYTDPQLPGWLQDVLVNSFHQITELGLWAQARPPIGDWCRPEDGIFGMLESRACPQIECGPSSYYGGMPIEFFFPRLIESTLRAHKAYQYADGCPTWIFGGVTARTGPCEMTKPTRGYQTGQNGSWYVGMVARHWQRTGDGTFLGEFYPSLVKATLFTFRLNRNFPDGLISLPEFDLQESYESTPFKGVSAHVASVRLYHLKMMEKIARHIGDLSFAKQCQDWYDQACRVLEEQLWTGSYYLQHKNPATGETADVVMGYQLDGEGMARFDGIPEGAFPTERVRTTLETLKRVAVDTWGPRVWSDPGGGPVDPRKFDPGYWSVSGVHPCGSLMLAVTFIYHHEVEFGLDIARRVMENIACRLRRQWDMPNLFRGDTGAGIYGNDYAQVMMDWLLPAALADQDLAAYSASPQGLVQRILQIGQTLNEKSIKGTGEND